MIPLPLDWNDKLNQFNVDKSFQSSSYGEPQSSDSLAFHLLEEYEESKIQIGFLLKPQFHLWRIVSPTRSLAFESVARDAKQNTFLTGPDVDTT